MAESDQFPSQQAARSTDGGGSLSASGATLFENPFSIEDLMVFDDVTMRRILSSGSFGLTLEDLAWSMQGASKTLVKRARRNLSPERRKQFAQELRRPLKKEQVEAARRRLLDGLFWELTYWKTPELYDELTEGEQLHPGIFQQLETDLYGKTVLDIGAGSGRASFECVRHGVQLVYAVEPSRGLLRVLKQKLTSESAGEIGSRIIPYQGSFDRIPLENDSVDLALSCSAFTRAPEQGGEPGLAELRRVTKADGKIVLIWPRGEDYNWLLEHGFQYVALPIQEEMSVRFRTLQSALHCARLFYAHNKAVVSYLLERQRPEVPYSVLGFNPPYDYFWHLVK